MKCQIKRKLGTKYLYQIRYQDTKSEITAKLGENILRLPITNILDSQEKQTQILLGGTPSHSRLLGFPRIIPVNMGGFIP